MIESFITSIPRHSNTASSKHVRRMGVILRSASSMILSTSAPPSDLPVPAPPLRLYSSSLGSRSVMMLQYGLNVMVGMSMMTA